MNKSKQILKVMMAFVLMAAFMLGCKKDEEGEPAFQLSAFTANDVDLNGATSPNNVDPEATITATFAAEVDPATATTQNVKLIRDYDDAEIPITVTGSGNTLTIDPVDPLGTGTLYIIQLGAGLASKGGQAFTATERNFTTLGTFSPAGAIAHWTFEDSAEDIIDAYDPSADGVVGITFEASRNAAAGKAATFNGDNSIIEIPNGDQLINSPNLSLSFWVKTNSEGHVNELGEPAGHFVLGLGAYYGLQYEISPDYSWTKFAVQYQFGDGTTGTGGDLSFNGDGKNKDNGGWPGTEVRKDLTAAGGVASLLQDKWAHVVFVFNGTAKTRSLYINGELMQRDNFNLWPADAIEKTASAVKFNDTEDVDNLLAFGFIQSRSGTLWDAEPWGGYDIPTANHFKGQLDDVMFFHSPITDQEIQLMYASGKP